MVISGSQPVSQTTSNQCPSLKKKSPRRQVRYPWTGYEPYDAITTESALPNGTSFWKAKGVGAEKQDRGVHRSDSSPITPHGDTIRPLGA